MPESRISKTTTVQVSRELKAMLDSLGNKGDTYEAIIRRAIEAVGYTNTHGKPK